jgi:hypothetical protein
MKYLAGMLAVAAGVLALGTAAVAQDQDAQSLGDAARQARQQKQKDNQPEKTSAAPKNPQSAPTSAAKNKNKNKDADQQPAQKIDSPPKDASANPQPPKPGKRVITNDEIPEHIGPTSTLPQGSGLPNNPYPQPGYQPNNNPGAAEQWKNQILAAKNYITSMQSEIANLEGSVHYAGGNCVSRCVEWNERQKEKQEQVEVMKQQLEQQQKRLEEMQELARKQGFGSSVYDP